jgi:phosphatidylglycerophosphate synthase
VNQSGYNPADRRPIKARELAWSQRIAAWLADRGVSPNAISVAGMLAGLLGGLAFAATNWGTSYTWCFWLAAAALVQCRLLANMFDGMVAVRRNIASPLGELYNEVPDRISDAALLIGAGYAAGGHPLVGFGAALAAVFTAYVRAAAKVAGAPNDFCGPFAKQQRMFAITVLALYCAAAPRAWQPTWNFASEAFGLAAVVLAVVLVGSLLTAIRRLWRAARFLRKPPT